ncbi:oocyte zinc finger protein XlCOF6-like isoform X2 [Conger conger]|uniref:oocyte zinc finger protein XlCOF6-like isoform X2 n=1 Tax=Conger conger TaxID=82655 RepID=UPI002A5A0C7A|nr:oocyte zinc finger protein XlCOF6-like isoform X2 [Conger conger]XP_061101698.1 oocyte zinc finger protein XlCOF6-like isoform X2 [Conger conger]
MDINTLRLKVASIMEVLAKTAVAEMTKLVDDESAALRLEMCRSRRENEALKAKLLLMEGELRAVRGYGEGTPGNSLNISFEVQVCDEFREAQRPKVTERVGDERWCTAPAKDDQNMEKERDPLDALDIKYEPVDGEQDWSESLLLGEDRLEEDPKSSQSQTEQKISQENTCGTLGAAAGSGGEGPLCEKNKLKQEPEGQPLTLGPPPLGSTVGLDLQSGWSEAASSGTIQENNVRLGGSAELVGAQLDSDLSSPRCRASRRLRSAHGPPEDILAEMPFPLGSPGECDGSAPCEASSDTSAEAKSPCRTEGEEEEFICTRSEKTFPDALELKTHEEQHSAGKRFSCSECGKGFTSFSVLEEHQRIHSRKKPFSCSGCDKTFSQWHVLQAHEDVHKKQKLYVCTDCGKRFLYKGYLKTHQRVHTREKPFTCDQCGKCFSQISNLKTHQVTHTGEKCFSCTVCNKSFSHLHVLKHHQRIHTGEKRLNCKLCGKLFDSADSMKVHRSTHYREKRFRCIACGKDFTAKSSLQTHQSVHTGEKPYLCNVCGKSFAHQCNLKTHQRIHTGEKPFSCTLCGRSFSQNHVLQKHMLTHS